MIEFQAAPKPDATDLRVMLEEEREDRELELSRRQEVEAKRGRFERDAKRAYAVYERQKRLDRAPKIGWYALYGLMLAAIPVTFMEIDSVLHLQAMVLAIASVPATIALPFIWKADEARKLKKKAIAARERFENFDVSQKEVAE